MKTKILKRLGAIALCIAMTFVMMPEVSFADSGVASVTTSGGETTNYTSLEDAVTAVNTNGGTLTLLASADVTSTLSFSNTVTLDTNEYDLTAAGDDANPLISVGSGANLTIEGSGIISNGSITHDVISVSGGTLNLTGATIQNNAEKHQAIDISGSGTVNMTSGTVNGGSYTDGTTGNTTAAIIVGNGTLNITGGTVTGGKYGIFAYGTNASPYITIGSDDGTSASPIISSVRIDSVKNKESYPLTLKSGTINKTSAYNGVVVQVSAAPISELKLGDSNFENHLPAGVTLTESDGAYFVNNLEKEDAAAKITADGVDYYYANLSAAAEVLKDGQTLTLLQNATTTKSIEIKVKNATIDLNGKTISASGAVPIIIDPEGTTPATGTVLIKNGTLATDGSKFIKANTHHGTVTIKTESLTTEGSAKDVLTISNGARVAASDAETMKNLANPGFIVSDGTTEYCYGDEAFTYAVLHSNGGKETIKLAADITSGDSLSPQDHNGVTDVTLDLNGHTYTYTGVNAAILFDDDSEEESFTVIDSSTNKTGAIKATDDEDGTVVFFSGNASNKTFNATGVELVTEGYYGITSNAGHNGTDFVNLDDVTLSSKGVAIYSPTAGEVNINNCEIAAKYSGVQLASGKLTITGNDTRITVGTADTSSSHSGSGAISDGACISLVNRGYPGGAPTAEIKAGRFISMADTDAIKAYTWDDVNRTEETWAGAEQNVNVYGGSFSSAVPQALAAPGYVGGEYVKTADGYYTVKKLENSANDTNSSGTNNGSSAAKVSQKVAKTSAADTGDATNIALYAGIAILMLLANAFACRRETQK